MAKNDSPTSTAVAVTPPPVRRGRKAAEIDSALVESMKGLVENGDWAGDGQTYDDKAKANKAIVDYKRALKDAGVEGDLTSRTWDNPDGEGVLIAIGRKSE